MTWVFVQIDESNAGVETVYGPYEDDYDARNANSSIYGFEMELGTDSSTIDVDALRAQYEEFESENYNQNERIESLEYTVEEKDTEIQVANTLGLLGRNTSGQVDERNRNVLFGEMVAERRIRDEDGSLIT